ncbi:alpha-hydroxy acid oxidase [Shewanella surugensis]|uniref:Alpha-hydroxy-acid oxidizing protein n=1 Tax=Shewanella surugensis TaxID=212020 RepID=A0ABT0LAV2_9GAMM|nr:alpha-hydroxy acid oxidase [Shewanella surugensis]MCL1124838.1 alpha-hydroxy-acid oxidizing protein [Shewanella surugensis]
MPSSDMDLHFSRHYASSKQLKQKAHRRVPKFAYDYLIEGCMDDIGLMRNRQAINAITFKPTYIQPRIDVDTNVSLFGHTYSAPFGIAPIGLQGLMWPNAPIILAKAAYKHNIPYILSTVSSESLEQIAEATHGQAWYQLYNPTDPHIRDDIIDRLKVMQYKTLVVTIDMPTFGFRPRDFNNGLAMPPKLTLKNVYQAAIKPTWSINTLKQGIPQFKNLTPYMETGNQKQELTELMNTATMGWLDFDSLKTIRDAWPGNLVIKGIMSEHDLQQAIKLGCDGVIFSNHGARQLDFGESPLSPMTQLNERYQDKMTIMMDSGLRSGSDIAGTLALGAQFTFLGRLFMYSVCALGDEGGQHAIAMLKAQLTQVMQQVGTANIEELKGKASLRP